MEAGPLGLIERCYGLYLFVVGLELALDDGVVEAAEGLVLDRREMSV